jgi:transposase
MYYIGLDVHKKTISYRVKDVGGRMQRKARLDGSIRRKLDSWMKTLHAVT